MKISEAAFWHFTSREVFLSPNRCLYKRKWSYNLVG